MSSRPTPDDPDVAGDAAAPGGTAGRWSRWNDGRAPTVGARVVIRRHLAPGETSHLYTDVIGHVVRVGPPFVVRRQRDGLEVTVDYDDVAVLKVLPPRPVRNRDIRSFEWTSALGWPGTDFALVDGWFCRAGDDWSYRRGAAVPVEPWASTSDLGRVREFYARRGLPLRLEIPERLVHADRIALDGAPVPDARLHPERDAFLYSATVPEFLDAAEADARAHAARDADRARDTGTTTDGHANREVVITDRVADDWLALYHGTAGLPPERVRPALESGAAIDADAVDDSDTLTTGGHVGFARLDVSGELAAMARGVVTTAPDGRTRLGISCVETAPGHRRHGLAERVSAALARWGADHGATEVYLHAFADNSAGSALWEKLGMQVHHGITHVEISDA